MVNIKEILNKQKAFFETGKTKDTDFRIRNLKRLADVIRKYEKDILNALKQDLNKSSFEAYVTEVGIVMEEIAFTIKHLPKWTKAKRVSTPLMHFISSSQIYKEPYGSVLVMSPWNYPFQLTIVPLVGAIAAGNCVVLKPSQYSSATSDIMKKLIEEIFPEYYVAIVQGNREVNKVLFNEKFDYIFFTGSPNVGKIAMEAASKNLTPITLELGGKSPCIVDETANIKLAARRIIWGKFINAGQTCVAPDYIFAHEKIKDKLVEEMKKAIESFYGDQPEKNDNFPKIINQRHFDRLKGLMESGKIIVGGQVNEDTRQIAPTILDNVSWLSPVMNEEIFGPILPIMEYESLDKIVSTINRKPKPLALYYFTTNKQRASRIINSVSFGGGCINDTIIHLSNPRLPFGGVGESGIGQYHGKESFNTFSHSKSIMNKSNLLDIPLRYPPFKDNLKLLKMFMK